MNSLSEYWKGIVITLIGVLVLTPDALLIRLVEADHFAVLFWRGVFLSTSICLFLRYRYGQGFVRVFKQMGVSGLLAGGLFSLSTIFFVISITQTQVANTLVIISAAPLFSALLSYFLCHDPVEGRTWGAALAGFVGIAIIFSGSLDQGSVLGDLCAVGAAFCLAGNFVVVRRCKGINMVPALAISGALMAMVAILLAEKLMVSKHDFQVLSIQGLVVVPLSFALIQMGPRYLPAAEVSLLMLLETVIGPFWVWLVLEEMPSQMTLLGGGLLVSTLVLHMLWPLLSSRSRTA